MAYWFHRNPLKATSPESFLIKGGVATNGHAQKICSELKQARIRLLEIIADPNNEVTTLTTQLQLYLGLLHGFAISVEEDGGSSKLRDVIKFRWTNTLLGSTPLEQEDSVFETASILMNVGIWYTKHTAKMAGNQSPSMEEAKEVHKCQRIGAGVFTFVKEKLVSQLKDQPEKGTDLDSRVLDAYINQCTAEAQEVTIARAIELKHSNSIISALAFETAKLYQLAVDSLKSVEMDASTKWKKYLQFKIEIYYAYAYNYHGEDLLAEDKCGEAIKCLEESVTHYENAEKVGKEYSTTKGPGTTCKPHEHLFFRKLGPVVRRTLEKCKRENGFIYHQKVPPNIPDLELKATYGLVAPEDFEMPQPNPQWKPDVYKAYDITKLEQAKEKEKPDKDKKDKDKKGDIAPVKEADIPQSQKDPSTLSGCVIQ